MSEPRWLDPELEAILEGDPELVGLAERVRASRLEPTLDPRFQGLLRARLMNQAPAVLSGAAARAPRRALVRRPAWWRRPGALAWGGAAVGAALVAATVLTVLHTRVEDHSVTAVSPVAELHAVSLDNVITVSFSQPMDHAAVVAGLHIRPATEVTTAWQGNNLVITPTHHLAGNTPYTVTIDHNAARSADGQLAAADIRITFGTAPAPAPAPAVAQLAPSTLGPVNDGAQLVDGGNGTVVATSATVAGAPAATPVAAPTTTPSPSSSPSANAAAGLPSASPSAAVTPTPSAPASASAAPVLSGELVALGGASGVTDLGPAVSSVALSPGGLRLVAAQPTSAGTQIVVVALDGSQRRVLVTLPSAVLATGWLSSNAALAAEPDKIVSVDLLGQVTTVTALPAGTSSVVFAPGGGHAFAGSTAHDGQLIDLSSQRARALPGSRATAAFSGDGATVAWVDAISAGGPHLSLAQTDRAGTTTVGYSAAGATLSDLALDETATELAVVRHPAGGGGATLDIVSLPSGGVMARGPAARAVVFTGGGKQVAFIAGGSAQQASVPGGSGAGSAATLPDGTASMLQTFVDAQVAGNASALAALQGPAVSAAAATPHGLTRAYVVSASVDPVGTVTATARLIIDASAKRAVASFADETLTLTSASDHDGYRVTGLIVGAAHDEPVGPHVVHVLPSAVGGKLVLSILFDSDLKAESVAGAVTVAPIGGGSLSDTVAYDAVTRTATVTVAAPAGSDVTLTVGTSLVDVDGQALATPFSVATGG